MTPTDLVLDGPEAIAARIPDGACVALMKDPHVPMAVVRALIARGARDLHVVTVPTASLAADALIGAGCVGTVETSGVSLGEHGPAPFFVAAVKAGTIRLKDATCPAVHSALLAGMKGVPFMPIRGVIGSDLLKARPDWKVVDNPFAAEGEADPILLLPALVPDVTLLHVPLADTAGNLWIGGRHEAKNAAQAARRVLATAERIVEGDLRRDPDKAPNLVRALHVEAIAAAPGGSWPIAAPPDYGTDHDALRAYATAARRAADAGEAGAPGDWLEIVTPRPARAAE